MLRHSFDQIVKHPDEPERIERLSSGSSEFYIGNGTEVHLPVARNLPDHHFNGSSILNDETNRQRGRCQPCCEKYAISIPRKLMKERKSQSISVWADMDFVRARSQNYGAQIASCSLNCRLDLVSPSADSRNINMFLVWWFSMDNSSFLQEPNAARRSWILVWFHMRSGGDNRRPARMNLWSRQPHNLWGYGSDGRCSASQQHFWFYVRGVLNRSKPMVVRALVVGCGRSHIPQCSERISYDWTRIISNYLHGFSGNATDNLCCITHLWRLPRNQQKNQTIPSNNRNSRIWSKILALWSFFQHRICFVTVYENLLYFGSFHLPPPESAKRS